jgi:RND family efflux transporter MFP subunit
MRAQHVMALLPFVVACALGCSRGTNDSDRRPIAVTTATAQQGTIIAVIETVGLVTAASGAEQIVTAAEPARIVELPKLEMEPVRRGDVLVRFEIASVQSESTTQDAEIARAESRLANARSAHAREKELFDRGLVPRIRIDELENQIDAAEADLRTARAAGSAFEAGATSRTTVRAAFDGIVHQRLLNVGDMALPSSVILTVIDPERLEVVASMPFGEAIRIGVGNAARVVLTPDSPPVAALRVVARPESLVDRAAPVAVRLAFDGPASIPIGTSVPLLVNAEMHEGAILVPLSAIVQDGDGIAVFVVNKGEAERRPVTVGITDAEYAEITSGLQGAEVVVVDSQITLVDGARVAPQ